MPLTEFQEASLRKGLISKDQIVDPETGGIWTPESGGLSEAEVQALIDTSISGLVDSAPGALNTLNELAAALGDDQNFAATIATQMAALDDRLDDIEVTDLGAMNLLTRRAAVNAEDDHFDVSPLDAKWLALSGFDPAVNLTAEPGWLQFGVGAKLQPVPGGDWTIETEVIHPSSTASGYSGCGLVLTNGTTNATAEQAWFSYGRENSLTVWRYHIDLYVNGAYSSTPFTYNTMPLSAAGYTFLRVVKVGTDYHFEVSQTGKRWQRITTITQAAMGLTPTHFGLVSSGAGGTCLFNYFLRY